MMSPDWFDPMAQLGGKRPPDYEMPILGMPLQDDLEDEEELTLMQKLARASGEGPTSEWATRYATPQAAGGGMGELLAMMRLGTAPRRRERRQVPMDFASFMKQNNIKGLMGG